METRIAAELTALASAPVASEAVRDTNAGEVALPPLPHINDGRTSYVPYGERSMKDCKPNQRAMMARWLARHGWRYAIDKNGVPRVLRAYRDKKLGVLDGPQKAGLAGAPNREAFARVGKDRSTKAVQTRRKVAH